MAIFKRNKHGGFADVIRCDEKDFLVWKWHPTGYDEDKLVRENAIRTSSVLRVKTGEVAVFVYGNQEDYIEGPHDETIKTKNFPILSSIIGLWYEGDTPFQAEVYFINTKKAEQIRFGIPYFDIVDPRFPDFPIPVAVRGALTFQISDYREFVKAHRLMTFQLDDFKKKINSTITRYIKNEVINSVRNNNVPAIQVESMIDRINQLVNADITQRISDDFAVEVRNIDIDSIEVDKSSETYLELKKITKDITARQAEANITDYEERMRIQREEGQYAQHMATKQQNIGAYQTEVQGEVGIASAEALGKMGENGAGNVNMGDGGAGFNPMTMMAGIAVGTAVGKNIAQTLDTSMNPNQSPTGQTPPPVPAVTYYIAENGQAVGPFDIQNIIQMIASGRVKRDTIIWKSGTPTWERADSFNEFVGQFPPVIPVPNP